MIMKIIMFFSIVSPGPHEKQFMSPQTKQAMITLQEMAVFNSISEPSKAV